MGVGGYGGGPAGRVPWGGAGTGPGEGAFETLPYTSSWNIFDLQPDDMDRVAVFYEVSTSGSSSGYVVGSWSLISGGAYPPTEQDLTITGVTVPATFTIEYRVNFKMLPDNFSSTEDDHIYLSATDIQGPCFGLFVSKAGLRYTGSVHIDLGTGDLITDHPVQDLPGSATYIEEDVPFVIRAVVDGPNELVYLFVTREDELATTGHVLRALLPTIDASTATYPPVERVLILVRGTVADQRWAELTSYHFSQSLLIPNLAPRADAGIDQAVRACSIIQLDGSASFDPEGEPITYEWRLIDGPTPSEFVFEGNDGSTSPLPTPTGFTDEFYSEELKDENALEPIQTGDVITVGGVSYTIDTIVGGPPFHVVVELPQIPDNLSLAPFKLLRQSGISGPTSVKPTFYPDAPGFYVFDLRVHDGVLWSTPSGLNRDIVLVNVLESPLPRGCVPDLRFVFNYLSDFWSLVEGREQIATFWSSLAQVAATELMTLWQHEYNKSHRDIQRTFIRRWLHYDTLLGEPIPELTRIRAIWGGVTSSAMSGPTAGISGTTLVVSSPLLDEDVTITVSYPDPVPPEYLALELGNRLRDRADSRFSVTVIEDRTSGDSYVRIDAPFPFTIGAGTIPVFTTGDEGRAPSGSAGSSTATRTYKVERSLAGLGLQEDDLLVLDGVAYRIARLLDEPTDDLAYQRVVVKRDLPASPSSDWRISGYITSELLDFYAGLVTEGDHVDLEVVEAGVENAPSAERVELVACTAWGVAETKPSALAMDFWPVGEQLADEDLEVRLARVVRRSYIPVDELVTDVPTLQEFIEIEDDTATLRRNVDFYIEEFRGQNSIRFVSGQGGGYDVFEGARPPNRLWAEYTYIDNAPVIEANFGLPVELTRDQLAELPGTVDYLSAVRGLWYAYYNGPTLYNLRVGAQILLGLPFAEQAGTIEEIREDFLSKQARMLIRDEDRTEIVRSYTYPKALEREVNPATGERYAVGDRVEKFAPLVEGVEVIDYIKDPDWFLGLLNQGTFYEVEKLHKFLVRVSDEAFNLSALLFVQNFIRKVKPTYTYPLFLVQKNVADTEISVVDEVEYSGSLRLFDSLCRGRLGASTIFDEPRAGRTNISTPHMGIRNRFDSDDDPDNADPTFPTPDPVAWGYDKEYLCPHDGLTAEASQYFAAPFTIQYDSVFAFDQGAKEPLNYSDTGAPFTIPVSPGYTVDAGKVLTNTGTITTLRLAFIGSPGAAVTTEGSTALSTVQAAAADETFDISVDGNFLTVSLGTAGVDHTDVTTFLAFINDQLQPASPPPGFNPIAAVASQGSSGIVFTSDSILADTYIELAENAGGLALLGCTAAFYTAPTDYKLDVVRNTTVEQTIDLELKNNTETVQSLSISATGGDTIYLRVYVASGGSRTPAWTQILGQVVLNDGTVWKFDTGQPDYSGWPGSAPAALPAGTYYHVRELVP